MDFKVEIKCMACLCKFELRPRSFIPQPLLKCPNCGQEIPDGIFALLKDGIQKFADVPGEAPLVSDFFSSEKPVKQEFEFRMKEFSETQDAFPQITK